MSPAGSSVGHAARALAGTPAHGTPATVATGCGGGGSCKRPRGAGETRCAGGLVAERGREESAEPSARVKGRKRVMRCNGANEVDQDDAAATAERGGVVVIDDGGRMQQDDVVVIEDEDSLDAVGAIDANATDGKRAKSGARAQGEGGKARASPCLAREWACGACTLLNPAAARKCAACGSSTTDRGARAAEAAAAQGGNGIAHFEHSPALGAGDAAAQQPPPPPLSTPQAPRSSLQLPCAFRVSANTERIYVYRVEHEHAKRARGLAASGADSVDEERGFLGSLLPLDVLDSEYSERTPPDVPLSWGLSVFWVRKVFSCGCRVNVRELV